MTDLVKAAPWRSIFEKLDEFERQLKQASDILEKAAAARNLSKDRMDSEGDGPAAAFAKHLASLTPEARSLELTKIALAHTTEAVK